MPGIRESRPPAAGRQHSYSLEPWPLPGCEVVWMINGRPAGVGTEEGGLRVRGIGASGTMTVEVTGDTSRTTVSARVVCPDAEPANFGPMAVGSGLWNPCLLEPCKSAVDAYLDASDDAHSAARGLAAVCGRLRRLRQRFTLLLGLLFGLLAAVAVCKMLAPRPFLCLAIYILALVVIAELARLYLVIARYERGVAFNEQACRDSQLRANQAHAAMVRACPKECVLPLSRVDCKCD